MILKVGGMTKQVCPFAIIMKSHQHGDCPHNPFLNTIDEINFTL